MKFLLWEFPLTLAPQPGEAQGRRGQNSSPVVARCDTARDVQAETLLQGLLWFVAFLFSTTVHEAAHAFAALRGGDPTAYLGGQVSFSPIPHIRREPIGMLLVTLLT